MQRNPFVIKKASDSVSKIEIPYLNIDIMMRFKYYENGVLKCVKSQKALELMLIKLYNIIGENPPFSYDIVNDIVVIKHPKINAKKPICYQKSI